MRRASREKGATAVLVAVLLVVLIGFVALVVDLGQLYRAKNELQNAADSAALAGAQELDATLDGLVAARAEAQAYGAKHEATAQPIAIAPEDVIFGHWNPAMQVFTPLAEDAEHVTAINAVKVIGRREAGDPVALFFATVLGHDTAEMRASAIGVGGGPMTDCGFPMVVPDCALDQPGETICGRCMTYQDNNLDTAGWTSFEETSVGQSTLADLVSSACIGADGTVLVDPATGECTGACNRVPVGLEIKVNNGNLLNTGKDKMCGLIQTILTRGVTGGPAYPFTVVVPVLESTPGTCDASQFSSHKPIAGFAAIDILGAKCGNSDPGVMVSTGTTCVVPPSEKYVVAALHCDLQSPQPSGGGYFGLDALHVRLVR